MKKNFKCYSCIYCSICSNEQEEKCESEDYILYTTKADKELCDMFCGKAEKDS